MVSVFLMIHIGFLPLGSMAEMNQSVSQNNEIDAPQSRLSPEVINPSKKGSNLSGWIAKHKWWLLAGLTIVAGGAIVASSSSSDSNVSSPEDNGDSSTDDNNNFGQISGEW